jgi:hypothetical protein
MPNQRFEVQVEPGSHQIDGAPFPKGWKGVLRVYPGANRPLSAFLRITAPEGSPTITIQAIGYTLAIDMALAALKVYTEEKEAERVREAAAPR